MSASFGKITIIAGSSQSIDLGGSGLSGALIGNESGLTCQLTFQGANVSRTLYPGTVDFFDLSGKQWTGNLIISPSADLSNVSSWPGSYLQIDTFGVGERPGGLYPLSLNRANNVGGIVNTNAGGANTVTYDGHPASEWLEATLLGSPSSNWSSRNDGNFFVAEWTGVTVNRLIETIANAATNVVLSKVGAITQVRGALQVDQTATFNAAGVSIDGTNKISCNEVATNFVNSGTINSGTVNATNVNSSTTSFTLGSITRISKFTRAVAVGINVTNHGLGATPDIVLLSFNLNSAPVAATIGYNEATKNATTIDIWSSVLTNVVGLAIKF